MKRLLTLLLAFLGCFSNASGEILHEVQPWDTLSEVKQRFPNGTFTRLKPAWAQEDEAFYSMTGVGFPGTLYINFSDSRPRYRKTFADTCVNAGEESQGPACRFFKEMSSRGDEDALSTAWVRWVPQQPIPLERYRSKFGDPTRYDFEKDTMAPTAFWSSAMLTARLSDDKKMVFFVTTEFTMAERRAAWLKKNPTLPDFLK